MNERTGPYCQKEGKCLDQNGKPMEICANARESKTMYDQSPLLSAESICLQALGGVVESRAKPVLVDSLASISFDLDRAIALPQVTWDENNSIEHDYRQGKRDIFQQVAVTLHRTQAASLEAIRSGNHLTTALQLRRLGIFMPAFRTRVEGTNLTPHLIQQTHRGLCSYIADLQQLMHQPGADNARKKQIAAHMAECEGMGLLTRLGRGDCFPWPALAREEASNVRSQQNHDFYTLPRGRKSPYQIKTSANGKNYRNVAVIQQYDIFRAMKRDPTPHHIGWNPPRGHEDFEWPNPYVYEQILSGETPDPLAELLVEEARSEGRLHKDKKNALSLASSYILSRGL